jgi:hypothetical protein
MSQLVKSSLAPRLELLAKKGNEPQLALIPIKGVNIELEEDEID